MISTDVMISAAATCLPVPGACNSTSLRIELAGAYSEGVEFSTGSFWLLENSEFVEAWLIEGSRFVKALASRRL
jgi:hypothetical protein